MAPRWATVGLECHRVFVYGTLRRGFQNPGRDVLTTHGQFQVEGTVAGALYDLGPFPALVQRGSGEDRVLGEVYDLTHEPRIAVDRLDRYEGAGGSDPLPYERRRLEVRVGGDRHLEAWSYVWTGSLEQAKRIEEDDYVAYLGRQEGG